MITNLKQCIIPKDWYRNDMFWSLNVILFNMLYLLEMALAAINKKPY